MIHKNLLDILARQGFTRDGDHFHVTGGHTCSVYLAYADESLILDKVASFEVTPDIAVMITQKRRRYAVELAEIRCIRSTPEPTGPGYRT